MSIERLKGNMQVYSVEKLLKMRWVLHDRKREKSLMHKMVALKLRGKYFLNDDSWLIELMGLKDLKPTSIDLLIIALTIEQPPLSNRAAPI